MLGCSVIVILIIGLVDLYIDLYHVPQTLYVIWTSVNCFWYIGKYRKNSLLCFEFFFLIFFLVVSYAFQYITLIGSSQHFFNLFTTDLISKTVVISTLAISSFLLGCCFSNRKYEYGIWCKPLEKKLTSTSYTMSSNIMTLVTFVFIAYVILSGKYYSILFKYADPSAFSGNLLIVYATILLLVTSTLEFYRLSLSTCHNLVQLVVKINKLYVVELLLIFTALFLTGNRNEALLIILPPVMLYSNLIKKITNKEVLVLSVCAFVLMIIVGFYRQDAVESIADDILYSSLRDLAPANFNSTFLIDYKDSYGAAGFTMGIVAILSSIPFLGGFMVNLFGIKIPMSTAEITTLHMQTFQNRHSGLGTSLLGDVYFAGGITFVLIYYFLLGVLMAYLYNNFSMQKNKNIYLHLIYVFMFANSIYSLRSTYYMSFRYIGFSLLLLVLLNAFAKVKLEIVNKHIKFN